MGEQRETSSVDIPDALATWLRRVAAHIRDETGDEDAPPKSLAHDLRQLRLAWADFLDALAGEAHALVATAVVVWVTVVCVAVILR